MSEVESYLPKCPYCRLPESKFKEVAKEWECQKCEKRFIVDDAGRSIKLVELSLGPQVVGASERCKALADSPLWCEQVIEQWPGPIAHEYGRLRERLVAGDIIGAVWQLKDVAEIIARFPACVMYRDVLDNGNDDEFKRRSRNKMFGPAMSMGSWVTFANELAIHLQKPSKTTTTQSPANKAEETSVTCSFKFPQIAGMFQVLASRKKDGEQQTNLFNRINRLTEWRNKNIGHGAFRLDVSDFLKDIEEHLPKLHKALKEVSDVWGDLELRSEDGKTLTGADSIRNQHDASRNDAHAVSRLKLFLAKRGSTDLFPLSPIVQLRRCSACQAQDVFLFDSRRIFRDTPGQDRYSFIDYLAGHGQESYWYAERDLDAEIRFLEAPDVVPIGDDTNLEGETLSYGIADLLDESSMAAQYLSPTYLRNALGEFLKECRTEKKGGLWWLQAPGHVGKSTFVTGIDPRYSDLKEDPLAADLRVITFYIRREYQIWPGQFVDELNSQLRDALQIKSGKEALPTLKVDDAQPAEALVAWLVAMRARAAATGNQDRVLICIDGLDELAVDSVKNERSIIDFLPAPNTIPDGIYFVLTSRQPSDIPAGVIARLGNRLADAQLYEVTTQLPAYQELMRTYFEGRLKVRNAARAKSGDQKIELEPLFTAVLTQSDERFLYLSYITELLADETLPMDQVGQLPPADQLFGHFLNELQRLHDGKTPIGQLFKRILIHLAAAEEAYEKDKDSLPVVARELWQGLPLEILNKRVEGKGDGKLTVKLAYALYTLKPILGSWKGGDERHARYKLGLKGLVEIVRGRWPEDLKAAHSQLAEELLKRAEGMADTEGANDIAGLDDDERWRLRYFGAHFLLCELQFQESVAHGTSAINSILAWSDEFTEQAESDSSLRDAVCAIQTSILFLEYGKRGADAQSLANWIRCLALCYGRRGNALTGCGETKAALADYGYAIGLWKSLGKQLFEELPLAWSKAFAGVYSNRGNVLMACGKTEEALADYDQAIGLQKWLGEHPGEGLPLAWNYGFSIVYSNRGNALMGFRKAEEALADYVKAIELNQSLHEPGKECLPEWTNQLAGSYANMGNALMACHKPEDALEAFGQAIELGESLRKLGKKCLPEWKNDLATAYSVMGNAMIFMENISEALENFNQAISLRVSLCKQLGKDIPPDWKSRLASSYCNRGNAFESIKEVAAALEALEDYGQAISLRVSLREQLGEEFQPSSTIALANVYSNRGNVLMACNRTKEALEDYDQAIHLGESIRIELGKRYPAQWSNDLATDYINRGNAWMACGKNEMAQEDFNRANDLQDR
jgi:tetratricopeptide (TPR) repeat protein